LKAAIYLTPASNFILARSWASVSEIEAEFNAAAPLFQGCITIKQVAHSLKGKK